MPNLLDVMQNLQDTEAALARLEGDIARDTPSRAAALTLNSLRKRYGELEKMFASMASEQHLDVCSYRLIAEEGRSYTLSALASTLGDFQTVLTLVYDAFKSGQKKERAQWSAEIGQESSLTFGYCQSGSLGFIFTIPNERLLLVDSILDTAFRTVFEMVKADSSERLAEYARKIGIAPIRKLYQWATDHIEAGLSVDIKWRREEEIRAGLVAQQPDLAKLCEVIAQTSEDTEERITVHGILQGGQHDKLRFMAEDAEDEQKNFRIHPSDYVLECLKYLKHKGTLGKQLPAIALVLLGERIMELERDGLIPKDLGTDKKQGTGV